MKKYEKPSLTAISLSGNDQLCGSCADQNRLVLMDPKNKDVALDLLWMTGEGNGDDIIERSDFKNLFGANDGCVKEIADYCKFTSTGTHLVAWS